jgi:hypothetical protein
MYMVMLFYPSSLERENDSSNRRNHLLRYADVRIGALNLSRGIVALGLGKGTSFYYGRQAAIDTEKEKKTK